MPTLKIASWNINSIRAHSENVMRWVQETRPDILCLQELKCTDDAFPTALFCDLGYEAALYGQKTYNGVAILAKQRFTIAQRGLFNDEANEPARYIELEFNNGLRVASLYAPNGNPVESEKYAYKLKFMDRLIEHVKNLLSYEEPLIIAGDYNTIPTALDARHPENWQEDALYRLEVRAKFRQLSALGLTDAYRALFPDTQEFSFWDYQAGSWPKNNGIRIDHHLLSPQAADRLVSASIDKRPRGWEKPSDHAPVMVEISV